MSSSILQKYREEILDLAMRHGARNVRVFGSLAQGEGNEDSDLDLLVTLGEGRSLLDIVDSSRIEDLIYRPMFFQKVPLSPYIREHVISKPFPCKPRPTCLA